MRRLTQLQEGVTLLFLILFLLVTLSLGFPLTVYGGDGIGQPSDGLSSATPSGGGETLSALEVYVLYTMLNLLT